MTISDQWTGEMRKAAGNCLRKIFDAAKSKRKRWEEQGKEISQYGYSPNHDFQYQSLPSTAFFRSKEALTSEAIRLFGPFLYQQNPHRTVQTRPWASESMVGNADVMGIYLNHALAEYDSYSNARRCIDQAVVWGRAVRWTGKHPKKKNIICSLYDDVRNFYDDPDADIPEERRIVMRERTRPRSDLVAEYPSCEPQIKLIPKQDDSARHHDSADGSSADSGADMVTYIEAYAIVGLNEFKSGKSVYDSAMRMEEDIDRPMKYLFTRSGIFVCADNWEVPFYIDGEWPVSELDFYDYPGSIYPVSPLEPGLNYQRAINWLSTLMMGRMRRSMRQIGAIASTAGEGLADTAQDQVLMGADIEMLLLQVSGGRSLKDFLHEYNPSFEWMTQGMNMLARLEDRYNKSTGKYDILYYGATSTQSRTATDAQMKDRNSRSRLDDMRDRIIKWETRIARKDALAARFLLKPEDITAELGDELGARWGFLRSGKAMQEFADSLAQLGVPPETAMAAAQEKFQDSIDYSQWATETDYAIESDSIKRRDIDQMIDSYKEMMNQFVPTQIQSPDPRIQSLGYSTTAGYLKAIGADPILVRQYESMAQALMEPQAQPPEMPMEQPMPEPMPAEPDAPEQQPVTVNVAPPDITITVNVPPNPQSATFANRGSATAIAPEQDE